MAVLHSVLVHFRVRTIGMVALVVALALSAVPATGSAADNAAARLVVKIGTSNLTIDVSTTAAAAESTTGPITVVVSVPARQRARIVSTDSGFHSQGYDISFVRAASADAVTVAVTVPSRARAAVEVAVSSSDGFAMASPGRTNTRTVVTSFA